MAHVSPQPGTAPAASRAQVAGLGDVNADGFADVAVTAAGEDYLFGPGMTCVALGPIVGTIPLADSTACYHGNGDDLAGQPLSRAGDVDGDGFDDLLVAGAGDDDNGEDAGAVWLISGVTMW